MDPSACVSSGCCIVEDVAVVGSDHEGTPLRFDNAVNVGIIEIILDSADRGGGIDKANKLYTFTVEELMGVGHGEDAVFYGNDLLGEPGLIAKLVKRHAIAAEELVGMN